VGGGGGEGRRREGDGPEVKPLIFDGVRLAVFVEEEIAQDILLLRTGASETKEREGGRGGRGQSHLAYSAINCKSERVPAFLRGDDSTRREK
jgi:hypothetical protein